MTTPIVVDVYCTWASFSNLLAEGLARRFRDSSFESFSKSLHLWTRKRKLGALPLRLPLAPLHGPHCGPTLLRIATCTLNARSQLLLIVTSFAALLNAECIAVRDIGNHQPSAMDNAPAIFGLSKICRYR